MSNSKVHIMTQDNKSPCGLPNPSYVGWSKAQITCAKCKKTEAYKKLPTFGSGIMKSK